MEDPLDLQSIEDRLAEFKRSYDQEIRLPGQPGKASWEIMEAGARALITEGLRAEKEKSSRRANEIFRAASNALNEAAEEAKKEQPPSEMSESEHQARARRIGEDMLESIRKKSPVH